MAYRFESARTVGRLTQALPAKADEHGPRQGEERSEGQRESPPEERAREKERQGEDSSRFVPAPKQVARQYLKNADEEKGGQQGDGGREADPLEWPFAVRGEAHDVGNAPAGE